MWEKSISLINKVYEKINFCGFWLELTISRDDKEGKFRCPDDFENKINFLNKSN